MVDIKKSSDYCEVYEELANILGDTELVEKIYERFRGLTVTFPKKLYSREYVLMYIKDNYGKEKIEFIAKHLDLSERRVRQLAQSLKCKDQKK